MTIDTANGSVVKEGKDKGEPEAEAGQNGAQDGAQPEVTKTRWRPFHDLRLVPTQTDVSDFSLWGSKRNQDFSQRWDSDLSPILKLATEFAPKTKDTLTFFILKELQWCPRNLNRLFSSLKRLQNYPCSQWRGTWSFVWILLSSSQGCR